MLPGTAPPNGLTQNISRSSVADTFDLFSGGQALSEILQLDRALPAAKEQVATVDVSSLKGITIAEIDWTKLTRKKRAGTRSALCGRDSRPINMRLFPSFAKLVEVEDHLDEQGTRILQLADPRSEDARTSQRYQRQLCLSTSALSRLLGPAVVKSVAITGSDPYFVSGTDVAVLFETAHPAALKALLAAGSRPAPPRSPRPSRRGQRSRGSPMPASARTDRQVSSYLARIGDVIVVTNSPAQLGQLVKAHAGKLPTIASLPEYRFFRTRYPRGAGDESAFLFLSDATIRRWCSPRWRIGSSRRVRDAAC